MNLYNLAKNNVTKNLKNYGMYLFSLIFTVSIFESFKTLEYSDAATKNILGASNMLIVFNSSSIVISVFSLIFIYYSSNFFIKKRKKEIGLYALLGVENKRIATLLFFETLILGMVALIVGTLFGILFASISFSILSKISLGKFIFVFLFSPKAILSTVITFLLFFIIISIQSSTIIYKYSLIELFKANSKKEDKKKTSIISAILSVAFILIGYGIYFFAVKTNVSISFITLILVIVGTYLFFSSMLFFFVKMKRENKKHLYNGMNIISTNQLLYRIKGNSRTLATITILTATTLTAVGTAVALQMDFNKNITKTIPFGIVTTSTNENYINDIKNIINNYDNNKLLYEESIDTIIVNGSTRASHINSYTVIKESELNKLLSHNSYSIDLPKLTNENDAFILNSFDSESKISTLSLDSKNGPLKLNMVGNTYQSLIHHMLTTVTIVVKDSTYETLNLTEKTNYTILQIDNKKESQGISNDIKDLQEKYKSTLLEKNITLTFYEDYASSSIDIGTIMFIGMFLGLIFLVCTGSIIFFKQMSEAEEEVNRYQILKNIGVSNNVLKTSIFKQVGFVFSVPLIMATIHSTVALSYIALLFHISLATLMLYTIVPYLIIYLIYYFITSIYYFNTVS
ncbi:ABC transporter permease [Clostridium botulinum]|uniref:FtsX-like permease family protein n=1 Tax=Clostridium botulinum TaxID=1491 RepID=UPI0005971AAA|nr:ABC transporter permease [Clostridium botulinum]KIL09307.1 ABC transporter permease [Clostridium botulinum]MBY6933012.1 ABC transporter permease [Clostridium botulinum]NFL83186.1 ABC transporter permease [Clostridium botulinum]NFN10710.1 ABC transporter permease [Clostridium botulinum]NFO38107.1 ABC transporter permease [Clostridium botulinum]